MKKFFKKVIIFCICFLVVGNISGYILTSSELFSKCFFAPEVYEAIIRSKEKTNLSKIIIGDSVAYQLFNHKEQYQDYYSVASNMGISMVGQYIIVRNILNKNTITEINLIFLPASFRHNLDHEFTFNYLVKPFYTVENVGYFSENVFKKLGKYKFYNIALLPVVKITANFPQVDYALLNKKEECKYTEIKYFISDISIEYLKKIRDECRKNNVKFRVLCPPLCDACKFKDFTCMKQQIRDNYLEDIFSEYFNKIVYFPDTVFLDYAHFKRNFLIKNGDVIRSEILK